VGVKKIKKRKRAKQEAVVRYIFLFRLKQLKSTYLSILRRKPPDQNMKRIQETNTLNGLY
jgi:hypothetical protein